MKEKWRKSEKELLKKIDKNKIPKSVAIIMDGNGRWAEERGYPRIYGHRQGAKIVKKIIEASVNLGIKFLTLFTFSTENWKRPREEVDALFQILSEKIKEEKDNFNKQGIKLKIIGEILKLPEKLQQEMQKVVNLTENNKNLVLIVALSYGGRDEIMRAIKKIVQDELTEKEIDENLISSYLDTREVQNPDLLIRTGGEKRISNFLLWQIAYTELYFTNKLWPNFKKIDFLKAILNYQMRERRFGKI